MPNKLRIGVLVYSSHPLLTQASAQILSNKKTGPSQASEGLEGLQGPSEGLRRVSEGLVLNLGTDFFWQSLNFSIFSPAKEACQGPPQCASPSLFKAKVAVKEKGSPRRGSCPSTWRCSSHLRSSFSGGGGTA